MTLLSLFSFDFNLEYFCIQFIMLLLLILMLITTNMYYNLLYLFLLIFFSGLILCTCNNELTAGFLWVTEIIVVFVMLLLLFYVNIYGDSKKILLKYSFFNFFFLVFFLLLLPLNKDSFEEDIIILYSDLFWINYYDALNDLALNDFFGFFISYYFLNTVILTIFGLILFFGSIACVTLFRLIKVIKFNNVNNFFDTLLFSQTFLYSIFMRKQDLFDQNSFTASIKNIFSKND